MLRQCGAAVARGARAGRAPAQWRCLCSAVAHPTSSTSSHPTQADFPDWKASDAGWNPSHNMDAMLANLTDEQVQRVGERSQEEFFNHIVLKTRFPEASFPPEGMVSREMVRRKRLIYRSKQRGWLEVDLLLGSWAEANVMALSPAEMDQYEAILNCETVDIFNYIAGVVPVPARVETPMMERLRAYALSAPFGKTPEEYARLKVKSRLT